MFIEPFPSAKPSGGWKIESEGDCAPSSREGEDAKYQVKRDEKAGRRTDEKLLGFKSFFLDEMRGVIGELGHLHDGPSWVTVILHTPCISITCLAIFLWKRVNSDPYTQGAVTYKFSSHVLVCPRSPWSCT